MTQGKIFNYGYLNLVRKIKSEDESKSATIAQLNALIRTLSGRGSFDICTENTVEAGGWGFMAGEASFDLSDTTQEYQFFSRSNGMPMKLPEDAILTCAYYTAKLNDNVLAGQILLVHEESKSPSPLCNVHKDKSLQGFFIQEHEPQSHVHTDDAGCLFAFRPSTIFPRSSKGSVRLHIKYLKYA